MSAILAIDAPVSRTKIVTYRAEKPQLRELLTQGVLAGAIALFIHAIIFSFFTDNYSKLFIVGALHQFLWPGAVAGLVHGLVYWCYLRMFETRFHVGPRFLIAVAVVASGYGVLRILYPSEQSGGVHLPLLASWSGVQVLSFSVMTGPQWRPWRALVYGVGRVNTGQRLPASAIGLLLRLVMLFACFESIFLFICVLQMNDKLRDFVIGWLVVVDFLIGLVIALVNPRFWLTTSLAFVINAPWVYILLLYPNEPRLIKIVMGCYVLLWCAFLVTRWRRLDPLFSSIREELRYYYLVD